MGLLSALLNKGNHAIPERWRQTPVSQLPLLAMDLELTSLDASESHITSCGWIMGQNSHCEIDSARHYVIRTKQSLCQSPTIHGLTHEQVSQGKKLNEIFDQMLSLLSSHVCIFHHAALDMAALKQACASLGKAWPGCVVVDTLKLSKYVLQKKQQVIKHDALTLDACRSRHGLGGINLHNALDDSMATLELFFAHQHEMKITYSTLKALKHTGALCNY